MSWAQRLAVVLAIVGLAPTLASKLVRPVRPSLSVSIRFRVSTLHSECGLLTASTPLPVAPEHDGETAEETTDSGEFLEPEGVSWLEGTAPSRWVHRVRVVAPTAYSPPPSRSNASERLRRNTRTLAVARSTPAERAAELCRFLC
jgi:hypothetical protein